MDHEIRTIIYSELNKHKEELEKNGDCYEDITEETIESFYQNFVLRRIPREIESLFPYLISIKKEKQNDKKSRR